ncbi:MAG TPA: carbamoyltransferase C-terminal domain-containing protein [Methylomirabilota bacterium]|nr:carbamoyltransferase C-terminal domain-containing protein [Methylomirabilota bacterium]
MWLLGISPSHEASAVLMHDGVVVAALAEERLTRIKSDGGRLPRLAIEQVLEIAGISHRDVDCIAVVADRFPEDCIRDPRIAHEIERRVRGWRDRMRGRPVRDVAMGHVQRVLQRMGREPDVEPYVRTGRFLARERFRPDARLRFFDHHASHAMASAYCSGFDEAAIVTVDGVGHLGVHHTSGMFRNQTLTRLAVSDTAGTSAGWFYEGITELLGFRPLRHEGKVLGLAAWGDPKPLQGAFRRALRCAPSGRTLTSDFAGRPDADAERVAYLKDVIRGHTRENVAAAAQRTLEEAVIPLVQTTLAATGARHVALNGGVFANVRLNQHIGALPEVERVFVFPGMSDTGNSVGAALLALADLDPGAFARGRRPLDNVYWGPEYGDGEIHQALDAVGACHERVSSSEIVERTARAIHEGLVVGWFQGRMEFGPRALGNRSIVASAVDGTINKRLNDRLSRTEFMPFAPSVLAEHAHTIFADVGPAAHTAEFMTTTLEVRPEWRPRIPAVVHVDGTARPHLVVRDKNPLYHRLIARYHELSGIPLVLNTSFNVHEEPIVCQPSEAARALAENRVDRLAIGSFWVASDRGRAA